MRKIRSVMKELDPKVFIALTVAGIINAFGVTIFLFPVKLYDSGISGLSMLLDQVTPSGIPIFAFGLRKQGIAFTVYSIFTVGVYSPVSYTHLTLPTKA